MTEFIKSRDVQCNRCDAVDTLSVYDVEPRGVRRCVCSCCAAVVRVTAEGTIVQLPSRLDM